MGEKWRFVKCIGQLKSANEITGRRCASLEEYTGCF